MVQLYGVKIREWDSEELARRWDVVRDLDFFEIFAGSYALTQVAKDQGLNADGYDRKSDPLLEEFLGTPGLQNCINKVLRLKEHALCTLAPECSWWIFSSCYYHGRNQKWSRADATGYLYTGPNVEGNAAYKHVRRKHGC